MYNRNDSQKKIVKAKAKRKNYITKKNYVEKTEGRDYHTQKKKGK